MDHPLASQFMAFLTDEFCVTVCWWLSLKQFYPYLQKREKEQQQRNQEAREFQKNICFIDYAKAFDCVDHNKLENSFFFFWKILKEMGIPDHLTCLLRNLYAGQEATVRTGHGTTDWFQIGKGVHQGYMLSPCLFNLYAEYIMRNARLDEAQAGIKIAGRIPTTSGMQMTPHFWQKPKRN